MKLGMKHIVAVVTMAAALLLVGQVAHATCYWYVDKTSLEDTELTLSVGQSFAYPYQVAVTMSKLPSIGEVPGIPATCEASVYDSFNGAPAENIGTVIYPEGFYEWGPPKFFNYFKILQYDACGDYQVTNTASVVTVPAPEPFPTPEATISDSLTVTIHVPCVGGCSLTQGYWKTHSAYGPAPYDAKWALVGEDTPFFRSGGSWYGVLWTKPAKGNVYYLLAHQYIAAYLNKLNGANTDAIDSALASAEGLLSTYTPGSSSIPKTTFTNLAYTLDKYNNGYTGPGHCSE